MKIVSAGANEYSAMDFFSEYTTLHYSSEQQLEGNNLKHSNKG